LSRRADRSQVADIDRRETPPRGVQITPRRTALTSPDHRPITALTIAVSERHARLPQHLPEVEILHPGGGVGGADLRAGAPAGDVTIASYSASGPGQPGRPGRVRATRRGGSIRVSWRGVPGAIRYEVLPELADHLLNGSDHQRRPTGGEVGDIGSGGFALGAGHRRLQLVVSSNHSSAMK
jgi:hypothetical protein